MTLALVTWVVAADALAAAPLASSLACWIMAAFFKLSAEFFKLVIALAAAVKSVLALLNAVEADDAATLSPLVTALL